MVRYKTTTTLHIKDDDTYVCPEASSSMIEMSEVPEQAPPEVTPEGPPNSKAERPSLQALLMTQIELIQGKTVWAPKTAHQWNEIVS